MISIGRHPEFSVRCYCFSSSTAQDARQAATDNARIVGAGGRLTSGGSIDLSGSRGSKVIAPGSLDLSGARLTDSSNRGTQVSGTGNTVTVNSGADQLASLGQSLRSSVDAQTGTLRNLLTANTPPPPAIVTTLGDAAPGTATDPGTAAAAAVVDADKKKKLVSFLALAAAVAGGFYLFRRKRA